MEVASEAQVDYGYLGTWRGPASGRARWASAFSMVPSYSRHRFVYPTLRMDASARVAAHVAALRFLGGTVSGGNSVIDPGGIT